ncbi:hypothetical protein LSTR_LSTR013330 [Laodelphax striatellus]|uniref:Uncharacterized protein n=1 Tax=Laodelphax striatellus TaxID=195883 RepID=A0A482XQ22_LAOST|nr:hypothetical protein LSTR_LSTR013330 [Laodelphax striatellus]
MRGINRGRKGMNKELKEDGGVEGGEKEEMKEEYGRKRERREARGSRIKEENVKGGEKEEFGGKRCEGSREKVLLRDSG